MVVNVRFKGNEWLIIEGCLHSLYALLVLFEGKEGDSLFIKNLSVTLVDFKCSVQVID